MIAEQKNMEVEIQKISMGGDGIARNRSGDGEGARELVVFVPYSAPGDQAAVEVTDWRKNFVRARIRNLAQPGPERIAAPCPYYFTPDKRQWCGGCNFQHLNYQAQLDHKTAAFKETLTKIAGLPTDVVLPALGNPERQWRYRNKIQVPFGKAESGETVSGFFAPESHRIMPIEDCLIQPEPMMAVVRFVRRKMQAWKLEAYQEKIHRGWLRHLYVRRETGGGRMLVVFVTVQGFFPRRQEWIKALTKEFPLIAGICHNVNPQKTNVILGRKWIKMQGQDYLVEKLSGLGPGGGDLKLKVSASSFFQVNSAMAEEMYRLVRDYAREGLAREGSLLLDLYTGVGGIALACAPDFEKVAGVDETPSSIRDAQENLRMNGVPNGEFFCADVEKFLGGFPMEKPERAVVVLDPPRAGCSEGVLRSLMKRQPGKIVYVSCEPSTLARDLKVLCGGGYKLKRIQPLDLFPQSSHVESVSLLTR